MGAVLLQNKLPIAYASKTLTQYQQNYAQIEKEMLTIVFRFHDYIYGLQSIEIETDYKPLESLWKKPIHQAPARIHMMIMTIQRYQISVKCRPGKELLTADALSRAPLPDEALELIYEEYDIIAMTTVSISRTKLKQIGQMSNNN
jgi:hypothetical protein